MKHKFLILAFSVFSLTVPGVFANENMTNGHALEKRVAMQEHKIEKALAKGEISAVEGDVLKSKTQQIKKKVELAKPEGISKEEREDIRKDLKQNKKDYRKSIINNKKDKISHQH